MFDWLFGDRTVKAELAAKRKSDERFRALERELKEIRMGYAGRLNDIDDIRKMADVEFETAHAAALARYRSGS